MGRSCEFFRINLRCYMRNENNFLGLKQTKQPFKQTETVV